MLRKLSILMLLTSFMLTLTSCELINIFRNDNIPAEVVDFRINHEEALDLCIDTVRMTDKEIIQFALEDFLLLSSSSQIFLSEEHELLLVLLYKLKNSFTITFVYNNQNYTTLLKINGRLINRPTNPIRDFHNFLGWYQDNNFNISFDFLIPVYSDVRIYARFEINQVEFEKGVHLTRQKSTVNIIRRNYNLVNGNIAFTGSNTGSGFVFHLYVQSNGARNYWILTNNHVTMTMHDRDGAVHDVVDYNGHTTRGTVLHQCRYFDLAVVHIVRYPSDDKSQLSPIKMENRNPDIEQPIVLMAHPRMATAPSFGYILRYRYSTLYSYRINVRFPVISTSAFSQGGFSGGALLNSDLRVIGVHFAGGSYWQGIREALSIPIEATHIFLNNYIWPYINI